MKTASAPLAALINSGVFYDCALYTFSLTSGLVIRLVAADHDVWDLAGNRYSCGAYGSGFPKIDAQQSKARGHWKRGLDGDTWTVTIMPAVQDQLSGVLTYPDVVGSTPWLAACRAGLFDQASVSVSRAYFAAPPSPPFTSATATCVGSLMLFNGFVDTVECTQTSSVFTINDYKSLLTITLPRNLYQSSCRNLVFDPRCTLNASTYARSGTALAGSTQSVVQASLSAPSGSGTFQLGRIKFTSGANAGLQRTVAVWTAGYTPINLQSPFPFAIAAGDTFTIWPGCNKTFATCGLFGNTLNFNAEPFIPVPEVQLGV